MTNEGALAGIRIVEFAGLGPAPFAAMLLADMGADIIRIDRPGVEPPIPDRITGRGRTRVEADLKSPVDVENVRTLVAGADALIEGFRPGVMERLGLGPEEMLRENPRLVYCRMTGWGQTGPLAAKAGHDINYIALTGTLAAIGPEDRPVPPLSLIGDYGGGALYLVAGVLSGIIAARRTGEGQVVDCAMIDGAMSLMSFYFEMEAFGQWQHRRGQNLLDGGAPYYAVYRCADGLDLAVGAIEPQFFEGLCRGLGIDPANLADREDPANWPAQRAMFAEIFARLPRAEWLARFASEDACVTEVLTFAEAGRHPHIAQRQSLLAVGDLAQPAPAPRFSQTVSRPGAPRAAPLPWQDVLAKWGAVPDALSNHQRLTD